MVEAGAPMLLSSAAVRTLIVVASSNTSGAVRSVKLMTRRLGSTTVSSEETPLHDLRPRNNAVEVRPLPEDEFRRQPQRTENKVVQRLCNDAHYEPNTRFDWVFGRHL